jgi:hypothetical protein
VEPLRDSTIRVGFFIDKYDSDKHSSLLRYCN